MADSIAVNTSPVPDVVMTLARHLLGAAGAVLATHGLISTSMAQAIAGTVLLLVPMGWSAFNTWLRSTRFAALALDPSVDAVVAKGAEAAAAKIAPSPIVTGAISALLLLTALPGLSGCSTVATNLTTQTSAQVATFADAESALAIALHGTATWIRAAHPSADKLAAIEAVEAQAKVAVAALRADRDAGRPLTFTALNLALADLAAATKGN